MIDSLLSFGLFLLSFVISTLLIRLGIPHLKSDGTSKELFPESTSPQLFDFRSTGLWIGCCETLLVFVLVWREEFSALAIIIGAKEFVRKEKIQQNPSHYLLGTLVNLSMAVLFALVAKAIVAP